MLLQTPPHETYLIRLPTWGSAVIALGIFGLLFSTLATALRRWWGTFGLGASAVAGCALFLAVAWDQSRYLTTTSTRLGMWAAFLFAALIAFIVPAVVIYRVERREPRPHFTRTIGYGVASSYLALLAGAVGFVLVALCVQPLRATVA